MAHTVTSQCGTQCVAVSVDGGRGILRTVLREVSDDVHGGGSCDSVTSPISSKNNCVHSHMSTCWSSAIFLLSTSQQEPTDEST